jgi:hypothetical protein
MLLMSEVGVGEGALSERREELRAADVDREFVAERLKGALDEGRLSLSEYDERLRDAYAAKTYGDLDRVLADLPGVVPASHSQVVPIAPVAAQTAPDLRPGGPVPKWLAGVWSAWLIAVSVNVVIWLAISVTDDQRGLLYPWPVWVAGPWGAVLVAITITGLLSGEPHQEAQKAAERRERRERKRERRHHRD